MEPSVIAPSLDAPLPSIDSLPLCLTLDKLSLYYGDKQALNEVSMAVPQNNVTAFIGPSGCGKSTLLRCFNRMNDLVDGCTITGSISFEGRDLLDPNWEVADIRRMIGMVFQKPNPFPKSIFDNVAYGLKLLGMKNRRELEEQVCWALQSAALFDEVKDRLKESALGLSGGQQQRLVIARALAIKPKVLLLDEPTSALDPISTLKVEELIQQLKKDYTILIVTHNMQQAARVSEFTAFMYMGNLVEHSHTRDIFHNPREKQTEAYVTGRFG